MSDLLRNALLWSSLAAWLSAQVLKVVIDSVRGRRLNLQHVAGSGGMPSAHSTLVTALAVAAGKREGWNSPLFAVTVVLAGIVMYDAAGVRQAVSIQARLLNRLVDDFFAHHYVSEKRLRELVGHTPVEVLVGALLGLVLGWWWS